MSNEKKETYTEVLVEVRTKLDGLKELNNVQHKEILEKVGENKSDINTLCDHVNHENQKMDARLEKLEHEETKRKERNRVYKIIGGSAVAIIGLIATLVGILSSCGVI